LARFHPHFSRSHPHEEKHGDITIDSADSGVRIPTTAKSMFFFPKENCQSKDDFFVNRCRVEEFSSIVAGEAKYGENTTGEVKSKNLF
jgi:hypothetical protein